MRAGGREVDKLLTVDVAAIDRARILRAASLYLKDSPTTITAFHAERSTGGLHDYFSEGDYWWPDPANPDGPYIQRDGLTNPGNFTDHRHALIRLSVQMPALAAAWLITKDDRYARHAVAHLQAWFVDDATRMNPNLEYAQAIHGRFTGRGIGIIDTLHLVEVARGAAVLEGSKALPGGVRDGVKQWFADYLSWMTTSPHGIDEREAKNNHGTCWVEQSRGIQPLHGKRRTRRILPHKIQVRAGAKSDCRERKFSARTREDQALRLLPFQSRRDGNVLPDTFHADRQFVGVRTPRRARHSQGSRIYVSVYRGQE